MSEDKPKFETFTQPGHAKVGGRVKGSRNKLTLKFIETLCADFEEHGEDTIRILRTEDPATYARVIASLAPKELDINDNRLKDIPDDELDTLIELAKQRLARSGSAGRADDGKDETAH
jgi:hypothetical protein